MDAKQALGWRIVNWIGISNQLLTAKGEASLKPLGLTPTEFSVLNHFNHRPDEPKTVTGIAAAMQMNQPNVTKIVAKLAKRKALAVRPNGADGRSKLLELTPAGRELHARALAAFAPLIGEAIEGWSEAELAQLFAGLDRLKVWLDSNR